MIINAGFFQLEKTKTNDQLFLAALPIKPSYRKIFRGCRPLIFSYTGACRLGAYKPWALVRVLVGIFMREQTAKCDVYCMNDGLHEHISIATSSVGHDSTVTLVLYD